MVNKGDVGLLSPPRYSRNDPRNLARVYAGHLKSMRMGGYDYPIRRLRRAGDVRCVTLPPPVRKFLMLKRGDWLLFQDGPWPGTVEISKVKDGRSRTLPVDEWREFWRRARKVRGKPRNLFVTIAPAVSKRLSAETGDFLMFGVRQGMNLVHICAVKGGNGSTGSRRSR